MSPSTFVKAGIVALAYASQVEAVLKYTLDPSDTYSGESFFNNWDFITIDDPTGGFVDYQSQVSANTRGLIKYDTSKKGSYMGVDYTTTYSTNQTPLNRGRASVRIESKKKYTHALVIADLGHMPANVCGTWPAFWSVSHDNYPRWGEIDMLENINEQTQSLNVLHTSPGCTVAANQGGVNRQTGTQASYNCDDLAQSSPFGGQSQYQGCAATNTKPGNYGKAFNDLGGGIIAMEWTSDFIKMWSFNQGSQPANMASANPDTSTWGTPTFTTQGGVCNIDDHFKEHSLVFDTTFCGTYAGNSFFWEQTSCFKAGYKTCTDYVAKNPAVFQDAYWLINSVKVYKKTDVIASTSSSTRSTSSLSSTSSTTIPPSTTSSATSTIVSPTSSATSDIVSPTSSAASDIISATSSLTSDIVSATSSLTSDIILPTSSPISDIVLPTSSATSDIVLPTSSATSDIVSATSSLTSDIVSPTSSLTSDIVSPTSSLTSDIVSPTSSLTSDIVSPTSSLTSDIVSPTSSPTSEPVTVGDPTSSNTALPSTTGEPSNTLSDPPVTATSSETSSDSPSSTESATTTIASTESSTSGTETSTSVATSDASTSTTSESSSTESSTELPSPTTSNTSTTSATDAPTSSCTSTYTSITSIPVGSNPGGHVTSPSSSLPTTLSPYPGSGTEETTEYETSTVYTTSVYTTTGCAPAVTNCPAGPHEVTVTIPLYETICPITKTKIPSGQVTTTPGALYPTPGSHLTVGPGYTTSVVYATSTYTVTACPTYVKNCPVGSITTEVKPLYTTLLSAAVTPLASYPVLSFTPVVYPSTPTASSPESVSTEVVIPQPNQPNSPAGSYSSGIYGSNSTLPTGTGAIVIPTKGESSLTPTDTSVFSGAGQVRVGSSLAVIIAAFVMLF